MYVYGVVVSFMEVVSASDHLSALLYVVAMAMVCEFLKCGLNEIGTFQRRNALSTSSLDFADST